MEFKDLDTFTCGYIECMLWEDCGPDTELGGLTFDDIAPATLEKIVADCSKFQRDNTEALNASGMCDYDYSRAGHDYWLTRQGHGAGFWDGDWLEPYATKLTEASKAFGNCDLYKSDDGQLCIG